MFKDYDKYLSTSLKVYLFVLIIVFIMKLAGLDYFGLEMDNPVLLNLNDFIMKYHLENVWYAISIYFNIYIVISISTNDNSKKLKLFVLCCMPFIIFYQIIKNNHFIFIIIELLYMLVMVIIYKNKSFCKINLKNYIIIYIINFTFQLISILTRTSYIKIYGDNFIINFIYNLDYFIMLLMFHNVYFKKGKKDLCITVVSFSLQKLASLKRLPKKLQRLLQNKEKSKKFSKTKVEKLTDRIYLFLTILWNLFTLLIILFVAMLNDTVAECIFIVFSFLITKNVFGKAFHLPSMVQCFIVSNLTYYVLNRITTPLGISIIIPIMLGVGLSYFTSKLVKKVYKPLYRGMPEDMFEETILKVEDKDSLKYKICYDFYINKKSIVSLSIKYNYTEAGIRKIKDRVNDKIKRLN